jgi:hypothetical protein
MFGGQAERESLLVRGEIPVCPQGPTLKRWVTTKSRQ